MFLYICAARPTYFSFIYYLFPFQATEIYKITLQNQPIIPILRTTGMKKERKDHQFIKKPYYEGGMTAMKAFITKNLSYPTTAFQEKIEGTVYIRYTINYKGKVVDTKIVGGIGHGCDEEAIRLVKLLEFQVPKNRNLKAVFQKSLQIHFRLPKTLPKKEVVLPAPTPMNVQYSYTLTKEGAAKPLEKKIQKGGSYSFNIQF